MGSRDIVQTIYDAAQSGDVSVIEALLAEDVVLYEPIHHPAVLTDIDPPDTPGVWRGRDAAVTGITKVFTALRLTGVDLHDLVGDDGRVVGVLTVHGQDHRGDPYTMPMTEVFTVADGKVTEIRAYYFDIATLCAHAGVALSP